MPAPRSVKVLACPLLILHAEDDAVLPVQLGRKVGTGGGGLRVIHGEDLGPRRGSPTRGGAVHAPNPAPTQLFETARGAYKDKSKVKFIAFPKELGLGHDYISSNPELPALVK